MSTEAHKAWVNTKGSPARGAFTEGYEAGRKDERARITAFLSQNMPLMKETAGDKAAELAVYVLTTMKPDTP